MFLVCLVVFCISLIGLLTVVSARFNTNHDYVFKQNEVTKTYCINTEGERPMLIKKVYDSGEFIESESWEKPCQIIEDKLYVTNSENSRALIGNITAEKISDISGEDFVNKTTLTLRIVLIVFVALSFAGGLFSFIYTKVKERPVPLDKLLKETK